MQQLSQSKLFPHLFLLNSPTYNYNYNYNLQLQLQLKLTITITITIETYNYNYNYNLQLQLQLQLIITITIETCNYKYNLNLQLQSWVTKLNFLVELTTIDKHNIFCFIFYVLISTRTPTSKALLIMTILINISAAVTETNINSFVISNEVKSRNINRYAINEFQVLMLSLSFAFKFNN